MSKRYLVIAREPKRETEFSERVVSDCETMKRAEYIMAADRIRHPELTYRIEEWLRK